MGDQGSPFARRLSTSPSAVASRQRVEEQRLRFLAELESYGWRTCVGDRAEGPPERPSVAVLIPSTKSARVMVRGQDGSRHYFTLRAVHVCTTHLWPERLAGAVDGHVRMLHDQLQTADVADQVTG